MAPIRIDNWRTVNLGDAYSAPEVNRIAVAGDVAPGADPRRPEGSPIRTSPIVACMGRTVTTKSGTVYQLGRIDPHFRAWLRAEGRPYNPRQPITIKGA